MTTDQSMDAAKVRFSEPMSFYCGYSQGNMGEELLTGAEMTKGPVLAPKAHLSMGDSF